MSDDGKLLPPRAPQSCLTQAAVLLAVALGSGVLAALTAVWALKGGS